MVDYSETIEVYAIKVGVYSSQNEYMEIYMYQRSMLLFDLRGQCHYLTLIQCLSVFINFKQLLP